MVFIPPHSGLTDQYHMIAGIYKHTVPLLFQRPIFIQGVTRLAKWRGYKPVRAPWADSAIFNAHISLRSMQGSKYGIFALDALISTKLYCVYIFHFFYKL